MMMRPRLPPASWLLLLAAAATQCPDTDETLDLRVVLSDAQGFRRNDVRWSLSAASSMDAYAEYSHLRQYGGGPTPGEKPK